MYPTVLRILRSDNLLVELISRKDPRNCGGIPTHYMSNASKLLALMEEIVASA